MLFFSLAFYDTDTQGVLIKPSIISPKQFGNKTVAVPANEVTLNTLIKKWIGASITHSLGNCR